MNVCLILAGGSSKRFGGSLPKQYDLLNDTEVISYTINAMKHSKKTDAVVCVLGKAYAQHICKKYSIAVTYSGTTRNQSLRNGLEYIKQNYQQCEKVFINEAARPFITVELIDNYFQRLDEYDGVITVRHITDSLGKFSGEVTDRSEYYLVQAPEAFRFDLLYKHFRADSPITATSQQLPSESRIFCNFEFRNNLKITYPEDLIIAEALMRYCNDKAGSV